MVRSEPPGRIDAALAWRRARTFADLCALGARFVEGGLDFFPGWGGSALDVESDGIARDLAALNRAGFLTLASQPGRIEPAAGGGLRRQRAFVFGFVSDDVSRRLADRTGGDGIEIAVFAADDQRAPAPHERTPVGERDGEHDAFAGYPAFEQELALFAEACDAAAVAALARASFASAIDLEWGRERELWRELARALAYPPPVESERVDRS